MTTAVFFGLGSIGKRHMRLLKTYFPEVNIYHWNRSLDQFEFSIDNTTWQPVTYLPSDFPSIAFICSPTEAHLSTSLTCAEMGLNLFIEKPVDVCSTLLDKTIRAVRSTNLFSYVAYPLRYHPFVQHLLTEDLETVRFTCHTNAAKWPSARKLNHVIWELSHELDLSQYLLGRIRRIRGNCTPDGLRAEITCEHDGGTISELSLDLSSPDECRFIRVGDHDYPLAITDEIYLNQLCLFMEGVTENSLENAAPLFMLMEEFVNGCSYHDLRPVGQ